jgi:heptose I phosphotransferase
VKSFELETWDDGRLIVNAAFAEMLKHHALTTFSSLMQLEGGQVAKDLLKQRITSRFELTNPGGPSQCFYIKRHGPSPWKEYLKPWIRLRRPILGAANEWNAILRFHEVGIPTMTPVAFGQSGRHSFLVTKAIERCIKLSDWVESRFPEDPSHWPNKTEDVPPYLLAETHALASRVAEIARTLHGSGMHHQDFYLTHLLVPQSNIHGQMYLIDLGRVRQHQRLRPHWIVKDLAQLHYSSRRLPKDTWQRFLHGYFQRSLNSRDDALIRRITKKSKAIARHSSKNQL